MKSIVGENQLNNYLKTRALTAIIIIIITLTYKRLPSARKTSDTFKPLGAHCCLISEWLRVLPTRCTLYEFYRNGIHYIPINVPLT